MRRVTQTGGKLVEPIGKVDAARPQTAAFLNREYVDFKRELPFPQTRNRAAWQQWRRKLRTRLRKTLSLDQLGPVPTSTPAVLESKQCKGYRRDKIAYETLRGNWVTAYLLVPDGDGKRPAVICAHGHVDRAKDNVVGLTEGYGAAYAHEFARRGLVALAPDNAGMGERDVAVAPPGQQGGCFLTWARLNHMGLDLTGFRVFDLMAGVSVLSARADVDAKRIGAAGLSGGCWLSQVLTAMDRRIKAVILSGYFTTFVQTAWLGHCICHHPFGIGKLCDMPDISALIAPRAQFVESGMSDTMYPYEPAYSMVARAYKLLGAAEQLQIHRYKGGHEFCGARSIPWMVEQLT